MSILLLFVFILVVVFAIVAAFTKPTHAEKLAHSRLQAVSGNARANVAQQIDILRHDTYSTIPWLNRLFGQLTATTWLRQLITEADSSWTVGRLVLGSLAAFVAVYMIGGLFNISPLLLLALSLVAFVAPYIYLRILRKRRFTKFSTLLPDAMDLISRALRAGHSLTAALDLVGQEIADPVGKEFHRLSEEQNLGLPLRDALLNFAERVPIPDIRFLVAAMLIQRETGGNLVEVLDKTTTLLRERTRLQGEIRIYTAQGRLTGWILCLLPILMLFALTALNPDYTAPLINEPAGHRLLAIGAVFMLFGVLVIRKIIQIKV